MHPQATSPSPHTTGPGPDLLAPHRKAEDLILSGNEIAHLIYQAGVREGIERARMADAARAEETARIFYAMEATDADNRRTLHAVVSAYDVRQARAAAAQHARTSPYRGGPVNFNDDTYNLREVA